MNIVIILLHFCYKTTPESSCYIFAKVVELENNLFGVVMSYYVYILRCSDSTLYTGIATDVQRRLVEHNETQKGAKYTRVRRPVELVYQEETEDRSSACKREYAIKQLKREEKLRLINA